MRPWIIVLSSAVVAAAAVAALARPALSLAPPAAILPGLMPLLPTLVVAALAVYALCAILLTSGNLIAEALRLRRHLDRNPPHHGPARPDWTAAFERSGLRRLIPPPAAVQPRPAPADGTVVLQGRFRAARGKARGRAALLHRRRACPFFQRIDRAGRRRGFRRGAAAWPAAVPTRPDPDRARRLGRRRAGAARPARPDRGRCHGRAADRNDLTPAGRADRRPGFCAGRPNSSKPHVPPARRATPRRLPRHCKFPNASSPFSNKAIARCSTRSSACRRRRMGSRRPRPRRSKPSRLRFARPNCAS